MNNDGTQELSLSELAIKNEKEIKENFTELGIDKKTQEKLFNKLADGELIDSMNQENLKKITNEEKITLKNNDSKIFTFPDGSKAKIGNELIDNGNNEGDISLNAVKKPGAGTWTVKSYWCTGIVNLEFRTEFVIKSGKNNDYIVKSYDEGAVIVGGDLKTEKLTVGRKYESITKKAYSQYRITYKLAKDIMSGTYNLYFQVGNDGYESSLTLKDNK